MSTVETDSSRLRTERIHKLESLQAQGINAYPYKFARTHKAAELQKIYENLAPGEETKDVVKCSVFLSDAQDFGAMNEVYAEVFGAYKPARTTVAAGMVAPGMKVEIDCYNQYLRSQ